MACQQFGCGKCGSDTRFLCSNCNCCSNCCSCGGGGGGCSGGGGGGGGYGGGGGCGGDAGSYMGGGNSLPGISPMPSMSALPSMPGLPGMNISGSSVPCCGGTVVHSYPADCCGPRCPDISHPCPWPWYKRVYIPGCPVVPGYRGHIPGIRLHGAGRTFGDATRDTCCIMGQWGNCCPFLPCRIFEQ